MFQIECTFFVACKPVTVSGLVPVLKKDISGHKQQRFMQTELVSREGECQVGLHRLPKTRF